MGGEQDSDRGVLARHEDGVGAGDAVETQALGGLGQGEGLAGLGGARKEEVPRHPPPSGLVRGLAHGRGHRWAWHRRRAAFGGFRRGRREGWTRAGGEDGDGYRGGMRSRKR